MNKNRKLIGAMTFVLCLSILNVILTLSLNDSYAADTSTVDNSGYPTANFKSSAATQKNYVQDALNSASQTSVYTNNFSVSLVHNSNGTVPLYSLMKNAETPTSSETFNISADGNPSNISDKGLLYIIGHGYNATNNDNNIFSTNKYGTVTDNNIKQYVTQVALWLYIYENKSKFSSTYCKNEEQCVFTNSSDTAVTASDIRTFISTTGNISGYNYLKYIIDLVDGTKDYTGAQTSSIASLSTTKPTYAINNAFTVLTTDVITPEANGNEANFMYFTATIDDPNGYGASLIDDKGQPISKGGVVKSFKVKVPLSENLDEMDLTSIKVIVTGHFIKEEARAYHVTSTTKAALIDGKDPLLKLNAAGNDKIDRFADVLFGYVPSEKLSTDFSLYNFTKISKIDVTTSEELPGATLVLTKKGDIQPTDTWTSTNTPHYLSLSNGDYTLCETIFPDGYEVVEGKEECIEFNIDGTKIQTVVMENAPIPDTAFFSNKIYMYIGLLLVAIGAGSLVLVYKKKKQNQM